MNIIWPGEFKRWDISLHGVTESPFFVQVSTQPGLWWPNVVPAANLQLPWDGHCSAALMQEGSFYYQPRQCIIYLLGKIHPKIPATFAACCLFPSPSKNGYSNKMTTAFRTRFLQFWIRRTCKQSFGWKTFPLAPLYKSASRFQREFNASMKQRIQGTVDCFPHPPCMEYVPTFAFNLWNMYIYIYIEYL